MQENANREMHKFINVILTRKKKTDSLVQAGSCEHSVKSADVT